MSRREPVYPGTSRRRRSVWNGRNLPLYLREGAVIPMGPVTRWVGERPTDPLAVVVAPFEEAGRSELRVELEAPAGVELRR
jgi:alpha-glucosidase (family GH31 glycosyl hydrolase)